MTHRYRFISTHRAEFGQLYQVLSRLAADGLISSEREPQATRPDRVVHTLTPRGRVALAEWLVEPTSASTAIAMTSSSN
jgi:DNA-binding PadR family transcriptional regulator